MPGSRAIRRAVLEVKPTRCLEVAWTIRLTTNYTKRTVSNGRAGTAKVDMSIYIERAHFKCKLQPIINIEGPPNAQIFGVVPRAPQLVRISTWRIANGVGCWNTECRQIDVSIACGGKILATPATVNARRSQIGRAHV